MSLITPDIRARLIANGLKCRDRRIELLAPVCWIEDRNSDLIWLPTAIHAGDPDTAWGLAMTQQGNPAVNPISLDVLEEFPSIEVRDGWTAKGPLSAYLIAAAQIGAIVDLDDDALPAYAA